jgi:hypothetical protein
VPWPQSAANARGERHAASPALPRAARRREWLLPAEQVAILGAAIGRDMHFEDWAREHAGAFAS